MPPFFAPSKPWLTQTQQPVQTPPTQSEPPGGVGSRPYSVWPGLGPARPNRFPTTLQPGDRNDPTRGFSPVAIATDQVDWVFLGTEDGGQLLTQPTNCFDYAPVNDVVACYKGFKPAGWTTVGIRIKLELSQPIPAGSRVDMNVLLMFSPVNGAAGSIPYIHGLTINPIESQSMVTQWNAWTSYWTGLPSAEQFLNIMVIRRATPWSGDMSGPQTNPVLQVYMPEMAILIRDAG